MKRRLLLKRLQLAGWYLLRNGANHDVYTNGHDMEPIPRHAEIDEQLARSILRKYNLGR